MSNDKQHCFSHLPVPGSPQQITAGVSDRTGAVIVGKSVVLADLRDDHPVGFHGRKSFLWETARLVGVSTRFAFCAAAGADGQHIRILRPQDPFECVKMLLVKRLRLHHGLAVQFVFQPSGSLYEQSVLIPGDFFPAVRKGAASRRAAPASAVHMAGVGFAHLPDFRF